MLYRYSEQRKSYTKMYKQKRIAAHLDKGEFSSVAKVLVTDGTRKMKKATSKSICDLLKKREERHQRLQMLLTFK